MDIYKILQEKTDKIMLWGPLGIIIIISIGCILFPSVFYDNFIWKYFWGPVVSDAHDTVLSFNGVEAAEKFTWLSEIVYGLMVLIVIYWLYKLVKKWNISLNISFFLGIFPYVLIGTIARVFEDSHFFSEPFVYWFVTPLVYIQIVILVLVFVVIGHILETRFKNKYFTIPNVLLFSGIVILLPFLYFLAVWFSGDTWGPNQGIHVDVFFLIIGLVFLITLVVYAVSRFFRDNDKIVVFSKPINLAMIFGHMLDGITSYVSIYDPLGMILPIYSEKHPASDILMQIWPPLFPIVKFLLIILIIYVFDVLYRDELRNYQKIVYILKMCIFILGFAPGLRDLLRVAMGV